MHLAYLHYLHGPDMALNHVRQFADAARALGHTVDVHAMNLAPAETAAAGRPRALRWRDAVKRRAGRYLHEPKELLWNARYVGRELALLRRTRPDVLLVRDHQLTSSCLAVARRLHLPLVLEVNAPAEESRLYFDQYFHVPWLPEYLEGWKLQRADAITVVSSSLKAFLVERHAIAADKIAVVPNGADVECFTPLPAASAAGDTGCRRRPPVLGFVGSFQKWHGTDLLVRLMTTVAAARPAARFLLVGDGPEIEKLRQAAAGLGERATFTGMVPHERIPALVAGMDIGVLPAADFYRCPLKVIEWMAAGRAVIAPAYAPLRDLIDDGVHGLLFPPHDADTLTRCALRAIDDPALRARLGDAAATRVRASLTWTHNAERVLAACQYGADRHRTTARQDSDACVA
jgi:glycosyltransferase involved in cell wall biosynthesis